MPKRKSPPVSDEDQAARFRRALEEIEAAGDLRPDAEQRFERAVEAVKTLKVDGESG